MTGSRRGEEGGEKDGRAGELERPTSAEGRAAAQAAAAAAVNHPATATATARAIAIAIAVTRAMSSRSRTRTRTITRGISCGGESRTAQAAAAATLAATDLSPHTDLAHMRAFHKQYNLLHPSLHRDITPWGSWGESSSAGSLAAGIRILGFGVSLWVKGIVACHSQMAAVLPMREEEEGGGGGRREFNQKILRPAIDCN